MTEKDGKAGCPAVKLVKNFGGVKGETCNA